MVRITIHTHAGIEYMYVKGAGALLYMYPYDMGITPFP